MHSGATAAVTLSLCGRCVFSGNTIMDGGLQAVSPTKLIISNNQIKSTNGRPAIKILVSAQYVLIEGNMLDGTNAGGIEISYQNAGPQRVLITGNEIIANATGGISLTSVNDAMVVDNLIHAPGAGGGNGVQYIATADGVAVRNVSINGNQIHGFANDIYVYAQFGVISYIQVLGNLIRSAQGGAFGINFQSSVNNHLIADNLIQTNLMNNFPP